MGDALREAALAGGVQLCIARVATGNVAPSPKPSSTRGQEQATQAADEAGQDRRRRPDQAADEAACGAARTDRRPSRRRSERPGTGRRTPRRSARAGCSRAPSSSLIAPAGRRDVHPVDVGDEVHQAQQEQHAVRRAQALHHEPSLSFPTITPVCPGLSRLGRSRSGCSPGEGGAVTAGRLSYIEFIIWTSKAIATEGRVFSGFRPRAIPRRCMGVSAWRRGRGAGHGARACRGRPCGDAVPPGESDERG